jgi:hypothetical protein
LIDFIKANYEWLFSGIGVTFLVWLIHWLKKAAETITLNQDIFAKLLKQKKAFRLNISLLPVRTVP